MRGDRDVDSTLARKVLVLSFPTASGKAISYPCMSSCVRIDSLVVLVENWIVIQFVVFRSLPFVKTTKSTELLEVESLTPPSPLVVPSPPLD
jgi:hypothetical protein